MLFPAFAFQTEQLFRVSDGVLNQSMFAVSPQALIAQSLSIDKMYNLEL